MARLPFGAAAVLVSLAVASPCGAQRIDDSESLDIHLARAAAAERSGDQQWRARELTTACRIATFDGDGSSWGLCTEAIDLGREIGDPQLEGEALAWRALLASWAPATFDVGLVDAHRALDLHADQTDHLVYRVASLALGAIYRERGDAGPAWQYLQQAVERSVATGDRAHEALSRALLARLLFWVGDYAGARVEGEHALALSREVGYGDAEFFANWELAMTELDAGRFEASIPLHEEALRLALEIHNLAGAMMMQINLAEARSQLGHLELAEAHLAEARAALVRGDGPESWQAYIDEIQGRIHFARGQFREAAARFLAGAEGSNSAWLTVRARLGWARALRAAGEMEAAEAAYEATIREIDNTRGSAGADVRRATYMAANSAAYHELIDLIWEASGEAAADRALDISEAGRSRALLDALQAAGVDGGAAPTLTSGDIQALVGPDQVLVEYVTVGERLLAFAVTAERIRWVDLTPDGGALDQRVRFFSRLVESQRDPRRLVAAGRRLFDELLAPIVDALGPEVSTLVIVADGVLHYLPFDALVMAAESGEPRFVAERFTIVQTPSASFLGARPPRTVEPGAALLVIAAPLTDAVDFELIPVGVRDASAIAALPFSVEEAATAVRVAGPTARELSGADASEAELKRLDLGQFRVLHFATHAFVDEQIPLRSSLLLAGGDGEDGLLQADEIYPMTLNADLVVLSACRTGLGRVLGGEGVQSLSRAFLYAGARDVVATLWEIEDRGSLDLMSRFYDRLAVGVDTADALAGVKRALIAEGVPPRTWAAFVFIGQPDGASPIAGRRSLIPIVWALLAIVLTALLARRLRT